MATRRRPSTSCCRPFGWRWPLNRKSPCTTTVCSGSRSCSSFPSSCGPSRLGAWKESSGSRCWYPPRSSCSGSSPASSSATFCRPPPRSPSASPEQGRAPRAPCELATRVRTAGITHILLPPELLLDYARSPIVDDRLPRAENIARLELLTTFLTRRARLLHGDAKFWLLELRPSDTPS